MVTVQVIELFACAEELTRRDVAVAVAIHLAKPARAGGRPGTRRGVSHAVRRQQGGPARGRREEEGKVAAVKNQADVVRDLVGGHAAVAVAVARRNAGERLEDFPCAEATIAVHIEHAEQRRPSSEAVIVTRPRAAIACIATNSSSSRG